MIVGMVLFLGSCHTEADDPQPVEIQTTVQSEKNSVVTLDNLLPKGDFHLFSVSQQKYYQNPLTAAIGNSFHFEYGMLNTVPDGSMAKYKITFIDANTGYLNKYSVINGNTVLEPLITSKLFASYRTLDFAQSGSSNQEILKVKFQATDDGHILMFYNGNYASLQGSAVMINPPAGTKAELKLMKYKPEAKFKWDFKPVQ